MLGEGKIWRNKRRSNHATTSSQLLAQPDWVHRQMVSVPEIAIFIVEEADEAQRKDDGEYDDVNYGVKSVSNGVDVNKSNNIPKDWDAKLWEVILVRKVRKKKFWFWQKGKRRPDCHSRENTQACVVAAGPANDVSENYDEESDWNGWKNCRKDSRRDDHVPKLCWTGHDGYVRCFLLFYEFSSSKYHSWFNQERFMFHMLRELLYSYQLS